MRLVEGRVEAGVLLRLEAGAIYVDDLGLEMRRFFRSFTGRLGREEVLLRGL